MTKGSTGKEPLERGASKKEEYQSVRAEILQWQQFRILLATASATIVTAGLTLGLANLEQFGNWWIAISAGLLIFLGGAEFLSWYAGIGNRKMGSYIYVFHEGEGVMWEHRHDALKKRARNGEYDKISAFADLFSLNKILAVLYLVLGVIALVPLPIGIQQFAQQNEPPLGPIILTIVFGIGAALLWLIPLWLLYFRTSRADYPALWESIKKEGEKEEHPE
jgi:hypothetical protein